MNNCNEQVYTKTSDQEVSTEEYCINCYKLENKKVFCLDCRRSIGIKKSTKEIIKDYLMFVPAFECNRFDPFYYRTKKLITNGYPHIPSYTKYFQKIIKKLGRMIIDDIYIVKIYEVEMQCDQYIDYYRLKVKIYTKDEWIEKYYPFLKYCDGWWKYIFFAKSLKNENKFIPNIDEKL
jgi:hypothetical protein